jgi:hypothetical protein
MTRQFPRNPIVAALLAGAATAVVLAGPLDPPAGPVAPTYRTLAEVEPRIPISYPMAISQPGSYYLTRDITTANNSNGITITASNVTLDLNGFTLQGGPNTAKAINCVGTPDTIVVRNGVIRDWGQRGIAASDVRNSRFENLTFISCGLDGIMCGENCIVSNCIASDNGEDGIHVGARSVITACTSFGNTQAGFRLEGTCVISNSTSTGNGGQGISSLAGCHITSCVASRNVGHGIYAAHYSTIVGNTCHNNGTNGTGAGIFVVGADSRIEANNLVANDYGLQVASAGNLVLRNSASGNPTGNFVIPAGNTAGPLINASAIAGSSNPHANYEF